MKQEAVPIALYWQDACEAVISHAEEIIKQRFPMLEIQQMGSMDPDEQSYDPSRYQYDAAMLLEGIPNKGLCLYLVHCDLYYPGFRYLYGAAENGKAIVSDFRPDTIEGLKKEICHELGHALGLKHCKNHCVMRRSCSERELEKKSNDFCVCCRKKLDKLQQFQNKQKGGYVT